MYVNQGSEQLNRQISEGLKIKTETRIATQWLMLGLKGLLLDSERVLYIWNSFILFIISAWPLCVLFHAALGCPLSDWDWVSIQILHQSQHNCSTSCTDWIDELLLGYPLKSIFLSQESWLQSQILIRKHWFILTHLSVPMRSQPSSVYPCTKNNIQNTIFQENDFNFSIPLYKWIDCKIWIISADIKNT